METIPVWLPPTISKLSSTGHIHLTRYSELCFEDWKRSGSFPLNDLGNLFKPQNIEIVKPAIDRSFFFPDRLENYIKTSSIKDFCIWLNTPNLEHEILNSSIAGTLPPLTLKNISNLDRYRAFCLNLSPGQYIDAFHFWTAETHGVEYFLTMDKKFVNAMLLTKKIDSSCHLVFPSDLLDKLNISQRNDFDFEEGIFYGIGGNKLYL